MEPYFQNERVTLYHGDCFEILPTLAPGSFDAAITDPPYGITQCEWDRKIDLCRFHNEIRRLVKDNAAVCVFGVMPFVVDLVNANRREFRYEIIWRKTQALGFLNAKKMPLRAHENILVFYRRLPCYNPQKHAAPNPVTHRVHGGKNGKLYERYVGRARTNSEWKIKGGFYGPVGRTRPGENGLAQESFNFRPSRDPLEYVYYDDGTRYPHDVVDFSNWNGAGFCNKNVVSHPTSKPVPLLEYLVRTYTNEGETILDPFAGSGTAGVAAMRTGRRAVLIEMEEKYCEMAAKRLETESIGKAITASTPERKHQDEDSATNQEL